MTQSGAFEVSFLLFEAQQHFKNIFKNCKQSKSLNILNADFQVTLCSPPPSHTYTRMHTFSSLSESKQVHYSKNGVFSVQQLPQQAFVSHVYQQDMFP